MKRQMEKNTKTRTEVHAVHGTAITHSHWQVVREKDSPIDANSDNYIDIEFAGTVVALAYGMSLRNS